MARSQGLDRRQQTVAAEQRDVPGHTRGEERLVLFAHREHLEIEKRAREDAIEQLVIRLDVRSAE